MLMHDQYLEPLHNLNSVLHHHLLSLQLPTSYIIPTSQSFVTIEKTGSLMPQPVRVLNLFLTFFLQFLGLYEQSVTYTSGSFVSGRTSLALLFQESSGSLGDPLVQRRKVETRLQQCKTKTATMLGRTPFLG